MGQIAENILSGLMCSNCGTFFNGEHGFPGHCASCFAELSKHERKHVAKATLPELGDDIDVDDDDLQ